MKFFTLKISVENSDFSSLQFLHAYSLFKILFDINFSLVNRFSLHVHIHEVLNTRKKMFRFPLIT